MATLHVKQRAVRQATWDSLLSQVRGQLRAMTSDECFSRAKELAYRTRNAVELPVGEPIVDSVKWGAAMDAEIWNSLINQILSQLQSMASEEYTARVGELQVLARAEADERSQRNHNFSSTERTQLLHPTSCIEAEEATIVQPGLLVAPGPSNPAKYSSKEIRVASKMLAELQVGKPKGKGTKKASAGIAWPSDFDVISGRGGMTNRHVGNVRFRNEARELRGEYQAAGTERGEKFRLMEELVRRVKQDGGRFLERGNDGLWHEMESRAARKKAAQALRENKWD